MRAFKNSGNVAILFLGLWFTACHTTELQSTQATLEFPIVFEDLVYAEIFLEQGARQETYVLDADKISIVVEQDLEYFVEATAFTQHSSEVEAYVAEGTQSSQASGEELRLALEAQPQQSFVIKSHFDEGYEYTPDLHYTIEDLITGFSFTEPQLSNTDVTLPERLLRLHISSPFDELGLSQDLDVAEVQNNLVEFMLGPAPTLPILAPLQTKEDTLNLTPQLLSSPGLSYECTLGASCAGTFGSCSGLDISTHTAVSYRFVEVPDLGCQQLSILHDKLRPNINLSFDPLFVTSAESATVTLVLGSSTPLSPGDTDVSLMGSPLCSLSPAVDALPPHQLMCSFSSDLLADGSNTIRMTAQDAAGNTTTSTAEYQVVVPDLNKAVIVSALPARIDAYPDFPKWLVKVRAANYGNSPLCLPANPFASSQLDSSTTLSLSRTIQTLGVDTQTDIPAASGATPGLLDFWVLIDEFLPIDTGDYALSLRLQSSNNSCITPPAFEIHELTIPLRVAAQELSTYASLGFELSLAQNYPNPQFMTPPLNDLSLDHLSGGQSSDTSVIDIDTQDGIALIPTGVGTTVVSISDASGGQHTFNTRVHPGPTFFALSNDSLAEVSGLDPVVSHSLDPSIGSPLKLLNDAQRDVVYVIGEFGFEEFGQSTGAQSIIPCSGTRILDADLGSRSDAGHQRITFLVETPSQPTYCEFDPVDAGESNRQVLPPEDSCSSENFYRIARFEAQNEMLVVGEDCVLYLNLDQPTDSLAAIALPSFNFIPSLGDRLYIDRNHRRFLIHHDPNTSGRVFLGHYGPGLRINPVSNDGIRSVHKQSLEGSFGLWRDIADDGLPPNNAAFGYTPVYNERAITDFMSEPDDYNYFEFSFPSLAPQLFPTVAVAAPSMQAVYTVDNQNPATLRILDSQGLNPHEDGFSHPQIPLNGAGFFDGIVVSPKPHRLYPRSAQVGQMVTLWGEDFATDGSFRVLVGGIGAQVVELSHHFARFQIPDAFAFHHNWQSPLSVDVVVVSHGRASGGMINSDGRALEIYDDVGYRMFLEPASPLSPNPPSNCNVSDCTYAVGGQNLAVNYQQTLREVNWIRAAQSFGESVQLQHPTTSFSTPVAMHISRRFRDRLVGGDQDSTVFDVNLPEGERFLNVETLGDIRDISNATPVASLDEMPYLALTIIRSTPNLGSVRIFAKWTQTLSDAGVGFLTSQDTQFTSIPRTGIVVGVKNNEFINLSTLEARSIFDGAAPTIVFDSTMPAGGCDQNNDDWTVLAAFPSIQHQSALFILQRFGQRQLLRAEQNSVDDIEIRCDEIVDTLSDWDNAYLPGDEQSFIGFTDTGSTVVFEWVNLNNIAELYVRGTRPGGLSSVQPIGLGSENDGREDGYSFYRATLPSFGAKELQRTTLLKGPQDTGNIFGQAQF